MKDQFEDFVQRNREGFDDREPSPKVWKRIETSLGFSQSAWQSPVFLWRAAAIFFMALSGYLLMPKNAVKADAQALREFTDVESFYVQQISNKVELIGEFKGNDGLNGFTHDFQQLEAMYLVLKDEMKTSPSQKVKDALVLNLLVRINLLNQQLQRLEEDVEPRNEEADKEERKT